MMKALAVVGIALAAASAAAQTSVGNPPGNTLSPQTGAVAPSAPPAAAPAGDLVTRTPAQLAAEKYRTEVVCKTTIETGSLIARHKTCLTRKQWQYVNDENERLARKVVEDGTGRPGSN